MKLCAGVAAAILLLACTAASLPTSLDQEVAAGDGVPRKREEDTSTASYRQLLQTTLAEAGDIVENKSTCTPSVLELLATPPAELQVAGNTTQFSIFTTLLRDTGILSKLKGEGPWTLLAPADASFETLLDKFEEFSVADVRAVLLGHVVRGKIDSAKLRASPSVNTLGGSTVKISEKFFTKVTNDGARTIASRTTFDDAPMLAGPIAACDGIVFAIGGVLSPPIPVAEVEAAIPVDAPPPPPPTGDMGAGVGSTQSLPNNVRDESNLPVGCYIPGIRGYVNTCADELGGSGRVQNTPRPRPAPRPELETFSQTYSIPVTGGALEVEMVFNRPRAKFFPQRNPFKNPTPAAPQAAGVEAVQRTSGCAFEVPPDDVCTDTCQFANDGTCDDESFCALGTDCADCGARAIQSPTILGQVKATLRSALEKCKPIAGPMLRLGFHDAGTFNSRGGTGGANGSIRFRQEVDDPKNNNLQSVVAVMGDVKREMDALSARTERPVMSLADMIQLAAVEAVKVTGGPDIPVRIGRVDVNRPDNTQTLPANRISIAELRRLANNYGLTDRDVVAITGAHTVGAQSSITPEVFDNAHFGLVLRAQARLQTDNVLNQDRSFRNILQEFATDQQSFFDQFLSMYLKISELGTSNLRPQDEL